MNSTIFVTKSRNPRFRDVRQWLNCLHGSLRYGTITDAMKNCKILIGICAVIALEGVAMAEYDFTKAWKDVEEAQMKGLPRTVTNKVDEIQREAVKVERWPDAARAFLVREQAMQEFTDEQTADWLPAFAVSVDAQPAPLQAVLQLHLAHTYVENSRRWRWGG